MLDPLKNYSCDYGRISKKELSPIIIKLENKVGEFLDVYCVAKNKKKIAALDFSNYGKKKFRKKDKSLINKIIKYSNYKNIKALHNKKTGGIYLKTIFFNDKNYKNALKLMDILWNPINIFQNHIYYHIAIGLLLGYRKNNIIYFIEKNFINLDKNTFNSIFIYVKNIIKNMKISLEDLNKHSNIILLEKIPTI